jgi:ubiquinone/menaquinone biosynthesis C-methylase UbiE
MSWFMAAIYDRFMRETERACLQAWRAELLAEAGGATLEVGAGTGANLPHYPRSVDRLVLAEPDRAMRARLEARADAQARVVEIVDATVEALPFADASFDTIVCTLVLCSVGDPDRALGEVRRVLRPGGRFIYVEHVAAEDPRRLAWQRRLDPFWRHIAGGCRLTRPTGEAIARAGFDVTWQRRESMRKALPIVRPSVRGVAVRAR